jgi:hypothetical protein
LELKYNWFGILICLLVFINSCDKKLINFPDTGEVTEDIDLSKYKKPEKYPVPFKTMDDYIGVYDGKKYNPVFLKGINLSVALPGTQAGELDITRTQYMDWFNRLSELGANSVRVYTLHRPAFYSALEEFNLSHPEKPLYVLHGIWYDDENPEKDLFLNSRNFDETIKENIDCVHGNKTISQRYGRAYGTFKNDISPWVVGWLIGREIIPIEVGISNQKNSDKTSYRGRYLKISNATPTEVWATTHMDNVLTYEKDNYNIERPVSISSWPTLDPIKHPTEPDYFDEDTESLDITKIDFSLATAGIFATYHAYPYYPSFINDDPVYNTFYDEQGVNNYLGYLTDLKKYYKKMPLIIGEYGVPSSWGNAHSSPSGMNHGGHDEISQGNFDARMLKTIYDTKSAGGFLFALIDEWWKRTWIVDELAFPRNRYPLWHNITSPEQNFGLIAFDPKTSQYTALSPIRKTGTKIDQVLGATDAEYFHLRVKLNSPLQNGEEITIGYDTYRDDLGESVLPNKVSTSRRNEIALNIKVPAVAQLFVTQAYDLYRIWHQASGPQQLYHSIATNGAPWMPVRWQNDQVYSSNDGLFSFPEETQEIGKLTIRNSSQPATILDAVVFDNSTIDIRIPWTLLQFTDPSTLSVMNDDRVTMGRETTISEGIGVSISTADSIIETVRYKWSSWDRVPAYKIREKKSMEIFGRALQALPGKL